MMMQMKTGAGRYTQGTEVLETVGHELKRLGHRKACIISGKTAFEQAGERLTAGLDQAGVAYARYEYGGHCTLADIGTIAAWVERQAPDCVLGLGGGKIMDCAKAVAAAVKIPVFCVPTVAATCAAFAPLSVIYKEDGSQQKIFFHDDSVSGVFVDLTVLARAPVRYLAAGIADAFAKMCEYSSMREEVRYGDIDFGRYMGYRIARESDQILMQCALAAFADNEAHRVTDAFSNALTCLIGVVGVISGFGAYCSHGSARFAIAHAFNEIIRVRYVPDPRRWLHGEIVGVGILAQLRANGMAEGYIQQMTSLFKEMHLPLTLSDLGICREDAQLDGFTSQLIGHIKAEPQYEERIRQAVRAVR